MWQLCDITSRKLPKKTTIEIGCGSFYHHDPQSLNDSGFFFFFFFLDYNFKIYRACYILLERYFQEIGCCSFWHSFLLVHVNESNNQSMRIYIETKQPYMPNTRTLANAIDMVAMTKIRLVQSHQPFNKPSNKNVYLTPKLTYQQYGLLSKWIE